LPKFTAVDLALLFKGFSAIEATLRTPDGKVWKEDRSSLKIQPAKYDKKQKGENASICRFGFF